MLKPSRNVRRSALLILSLLSACGASDLSSDGSERVSRYKPSGAFGAYLTGRFAAQRSDLGVAAEKLETALTDDPGVPELANQAFLAALLAGRPDATRLATSLPDNPVAQLVIADHEAKAGRWDAAETQFSRLPPQGLTQVLRPLLVAWAQQGAGRTDAALGTLAPVIESTRFRGVYALHAAMIADLAGQPLEAARLYRVAATEYGPLNLRLGLILASWQARQGATGEAQRTIRDLAGTNGDLAIALQGLEANMAAPAVRGAADGIAEAYLAMAATLRQQGSDSAQLLLRLALDMRPDFTAAGILLADIQESAKRPSMALATLADVPDSDPLAPVVQLRRASLLDELGRSDEASRLLDELARQHPDRPEPLTLAGDILRRKNRFPDAAQAYSAAIARLGVPTRAHWPLFYERGVALERAGQWPQAEADFQYALELAPDQPSVLNYLAYSWVDRGERLDQARIMLDRALAQRPNDGAIIDSMGWLLLRQGDQEGALSNLERAVELQPEDPVINAHLGDALAAVGRMREAEFQWRRALNLKPEAEDARKLTEKLAALPGASPPTQAAVPPAAIPR
ncbi:MAG TPA: tetratricopeptide repeat protein [Acetobacteraceae bacterium]|nr:tetratricopeptide repeat protein [Acetobacteraceae bacterium]